MQKSARAVFVLFAAAAFLASSERSVAVSGIRLDIGAIDGGTWKAQNVVVRLTIGADSSPSATVSATRMTLPAGLGSLERVSVTCPEPIVREPEFRCKGARVTGRFTALGEQSFVVDASYHSQRKTLDFQVTGLKLGSGRLRLAGTWTPRAWRAEVESTPVAITTLKELAERWYRLPEGFAAEGHASFHVQARGGAQVEHVEAHTTLEGLTANNAEGTLATDKLGLTLDATLERRRDAWAIGATVKSSQGQAYGEPIFVDFGVQPLQAQAKGLWHTADRVLTLHSAQFDQPGVARGAAFGELDFARAPLVRGLHVDLQELAFPGAYATLFQPFLLSTELKDLTTSGRVSGIVELAAGQPAAIDLKLDDVTAEDKAGKLALQKLRGHVVWYSTQARSKLGVQSAAPESNLQWQGARMYGLVGGPASIRFAASGADFSVLEPTLLPIFDGGLAINTLSVRNIGTPELALRFDAQLRPVSLSLLSEAFGWPTFGGKIEGRIPNVTLENKVLKFGGDLDAQVFGGRVVISDLQLRDPLGTYPRLSTNISVRNLDLEAVTGTFSFGTITGRLQGDVRDLELFRWRPIRFEARLETPPNDESRHLISQRAVNNLSSIGGGGGGVAAALQSGLLRFFENFRYSKLGLSCRLENEICYMDGVEPAGGTSYYIVKGSGIPRIDIIGNAHRVNWNRLVGQLQAMQEGGGPVVQ